MYPMNSAKAQTSHIIPTSDLTSRARFQNKVTSRILFNTGFLPKGYRLEISFFKPNSGLLFYHKKQISPQIQKMGIYCYADRKPQ
jgi:hypothetical protein